MPADVPNISGGCTDIWKGDAYCDDICNVPEYNFDGGDCCKDLLNDDYCSFCFCYHDCSYHNVTEIPPGPSGFESTFL